jgi:ubiquinone/menaquinone biosynthesis C-methylase UbiE
MKEQRIEESSFRRYLRAYLRIAPVSVAIHRAVEAGHMGQVLLEHPLLDLGCGFGEFGSIFFEEPADVGVDVNRGDLKKASEKGVYRLLGQADARCLPFPDNSFATIISVSTLEHISGVPDVLRETFRALRPGGALLFTVPTNKFSRMLAVPRTLSALRAAPLGRAYARAVNSLLSHVNLWCSQEWRACIERAGFDIECCREIISPRATLIWDLGLVFALPQRFWRVLTGHRLIKPAPVVSFLESRLARLVEEDSSDGSNLFMVARKPRLSRRSPSVSRGGHE